MITQSGRKAATCWTYEDALIIYRQGVWESGKRRTPASTLAVMLEGDRRDADLFYSSVDAAADAKNRDADHIPVPWDVLK